MEENGSRLQHVFIIPDGNRRWARQNNYSYKDVYEKVALETTPGLIRTILFTHDVNEVTFFMLSRSNLIKRSLDEVFPVLKAQEKLYLTLSEGFDKVFSNVSFKVIGDKTLFPRSYLDACNKMERQSNGGKKCNFLVGYDAEWELLQAFKNIKKLDSTDIVALLALNSEIDLMIRSGFEQRISGGPLIQLKFAELYFCDFHYPDFTPEKFSEIVNIYKTRERRFGR